MDKFDIILAITCFLLSFSDCFSLFMTVFTNDDMEFRCLDDWVGPDFIVQSYYSTENGTEFNGVKIQDHVILLETDFYNQGYWSTLYDRDLYRVCPSTDSSEDENDGQNKSAMASSVAKSISNDTSESSFWNFGKPVNSVVCQRGYAWTKKQFSVDNQVTIKYTFKVLFSIAGRDELRVELRDELSYETS